MSAPGIKAETSFYVVGGTVQRDAPCYVVRQADAELYEGLIQGKFCYVLTPRQIGKSSLMVRTAARLREDGVGVAVLDLTAIGQNLNAEQWYGGLMSQVGMRLALEDQLMEFWAAHPKLSPLQRWMQAIRDVVLTCYPGRVVIFVDEIDAVRSLPFSTDEFFAGIRELYNRRIEDPELNRFSLCLLGVATPSDLIRDTRTTPFNIGQRVELHDFAEAEAAPLAHGLEREQGLGAALLERVFYWTGGHPYLTQRLCQVIAKDPGVNNARAVDRVCAELFFTRRAREQDDNLIFVRERILRSEVDLTSLLTLYAQVRRRRRTADDVTNPLISALRLSGIARAENGYLRVRNRIYAWVFDREWVKANMPEAELRRQQAAYRKGVLRAATVAAVILAMIAGLGLIAVRQRNRAEGEARRADHASEQANLNAEKAQRALEETEQQRWNAEQQRAEAETQRQEAVNQQALADVQRHLAQQQEQANHRLLYTAHIGLAQQAYEASDISRVDELLASHIPRPGQEDLRGFEWFYLWRLSHSSQVILRLSGVVYSVAISPDGKTLAAGGENSAVKLMDLTTRQELASLNTQSGVVYSVTFSPDGKTLATASGGNVTLWDVATRQVRDTLPGYTAPVRSVTFSHDGRVLATGSDDGIVRLWDVNRRRELKTLRGHTSFINSIVFSPDDKTLATGGYDHTCKLWDVATGRQRGTFVGHNDEVNCVAFSPDGKRLATSGDDERVIVWDVASYQALFALTRNIGIIECVAFSPDGKTLATGGTERILTLWDVATEREIIRLKGHETTIWSIVFSSDGKALVAGDSYHNVRLWDIDGELQERAFLAARGRFKPLTFSPEGQLMAMRSDNQTSLKLVDLVRRQELGTYHSRAGGVLDSVVLSPQRRFMAASSENSIRLWDVSTGQELPGLKGHNASINAVAFSPDGTRLAIGYSDGTAGLWDIHTGRKQATIKCHPGRIQAVEFSHDGRTLATGGLETIQLWDVITGRELAAFAGPRKQIWSVAFSPDDKVIAAGGEDKTVRLWDVATKQELTTFKGHIYTVSSIAFSPDGKHLATGSADNTVKLWNVATGQPLITLRGHTSAVRSVVFSDGGRTLGSIGMGGSVKLWHAGTGSAVAIAR